MLKGAVIDGDGYRINVGIVLTNQKGQLFWGRRINQDAWQFPQGGLHEEETIEETLYRELHEEIGLEPADVVITAQSKNWITYRLPKRLIRSYSSPICIGQKQKWFLLQCISADSKIKLDVSIKPEFDHWQWVNYWFPLNQVVPFKREVYRAVLLEFAPTVMQLKHTKVVLEPLL